MLSPGFTDDERYVVCEITGYSINEVASFPSGNRGEKKVARRAAAYALADRLNAEDRAASSAAPT